MIERGRERLGEVGVFVVKEGFLTKTLRDENNNVEKQMLLDEEKDFILLLLRNKRGAATIIATPRRFAPHWSLPGRGVLARRG